MGLSSKRSLSRAARRPLEYPLADGNGVHSNKIAVFGVDDDLRAAGGDAVHRNSGSRSSCGRFRWIS
ncbi:hypothetical protein D3C72_1998730 [compost metagenome]